MCALLPPAMGCRTRATRSTTAKLISFPLELPYAQNLHTPLVP